MTKAMHIRHPAGVDNLILGTVEAPAPAAGEIRVRIRTASLNFRDGLVVSEFFPAADGLIPLSDGAGEVMDVGAGVTVGSRRDQIEMVRAIEAHGIRPVIDSSFPLERLADACRHLEAGGHFGKICIDI